MDKRKVINYEGEQRLVFSVKCPLCGEKHHYRINMTPVTILYMGNKEAYKPRDREILVYCPTEKENFKVILKVYYPYHASIIDKIRLLEEN